MNKTNRRAFIKVAGLTVPGLTFSGLAYTSITGSPADLRGPHSMAPHESRLKIGIASYTFREFSLQDTLAMTRRVNVKHIALKSMHLPLESSDQAIRETKDKVNAAGINLYGAGVIYMNNSAEVENAFRYAVAAGMKTIIGVPAHDLLDLVEEKVKQTNIQVAIHNHGPGDEVYPSPESIIEKINARDKRIGMCMDIGHTQRIGLDPGKEAKKYFDRLLDVHLKDVDKSSAEGDTVEIGRGVIDIPGFITVLLKNNYSGMASFEYEKDEKDPLPGLSESVGYINGILKLLEK